MQQFLGTCAGSRMEYVRDCQLASVTYMAVLVAKGVQLTEVRDGVCQRLDCGVEPEVAVATERAFGEALEESVQSSSIEGLMADQVREQIQGRVMQVAGVGPVRFVSCAKVSSGKVHIGKTDSHVVWETMGASSNRRASRVRCRQCLRAVALCVFGGEVQVFDS